MRFRGVVEQLEDLDFISGLLCDTTTLLASSTRRLAGIGVCFLLGPFLQDCIFGLVFERVEGRVMTTAIAVEARGRLTELACDHGMPWAFLPLLDAA